MLAAALALPLAYGPHAHRVSTAPLARSRVSVVQLQIADYDAATYDPEKSGLGQITDRPEGTHGTGYRFMPVEAVGKSEGAALLCIAGAYPGLTAEQLSSPTPLPFAKSGAWNYHMLQGDAAPGGFVALPTSHMLQDHPDTVAVVCNSRSLGLEFPDSQEHEVLAVIDRADIATFDMDHYDPQKFYAFSNPSGAVEIRWYETVPEGYTVLGKLLFAQMPFIEKPGASKGWAEGSDDFEF